MARIIEPDPIFARFAQILGLDPARTVEGTLSVYVGGRVEWVELVDGPEGREHVRRSRTASDDELARIVAVTDEVEVERHAVREAAQTRTYTAVDMERAYRAGFGDGWTNKPSRPERVL
ncbi:hypothetical protein [Xylanimonas oleitrophica]|nr:hypothetical protein [Xylanimonas oleitrophica]